MKSEKATDFTTTPLFRKKMEAAMADESGDLNALVQLETLKLLSKKTNRRSAGSDSSSSGSSEDDEKSANSFGGIRKLRRRWKRHPRKLVKQFEKRSMDKLKIRSAKQYWSYTDLAKADKPGPYFGDSTTKCLVWCVVVALSAAWSAVCVVWWRGRGPRACVGGGGRVRGCACVRE